MIVYRLARRAFSEDFSGAGAEKLGGRWNSKGMPMLYTASSRALCLTEWLVHTPALLLPDDLVMVSLELPENAVVQKLKKLPADWYIFPHPLSTREEGDAWLKKNASLVLEVPSAVVPDEFNYLINPHHPQIQQVRLLSAQAFKIDERLKAGR